MKILFLNEMMDSGAVSYYIREQTAIELARRGNEVTMISPTFSFSLLGHCCYKNGVTYIFTAGWLPARFRRGGFGFLDLVSKSFYILRGDYKIVHSTAGHRPAQIFPSVISKWIKKSKIIDESWECYNAEGRASTRKTLLGKMISRYDVLFELLTKKQYHHIVVISSYLRRRLVDNGIPKSDISVLFGAIDDTKFVNYPKVKAREKAKIPKESIVLGLISVGEADHDDNQIFIKSFIQLVKVYPQLKLFVTGEEGYIKKTFGELIGKTVIYRGWLGLKDYNLLLSSCDCFILPLTPVPRNLGRWPHKFSEFVFFEKPVITGRVGDQADLVSKFELGSCLENTTESYRKFIKKLIEGLRMGNRDGFKSVKAQLTITFRTDKLQKIYDLLEKSTRR